MGRTGPVRRQGPGPMICPRLVSWGGDHPLQRASDGVHHPRDRRPVPVVLARMGSSREAQKQAPRALTERYGERVERPGLAFGMGQTSHRLQFRIVPEAQSSGRNQALAS